MPCMLVSIANRRVPICDARCALCRPFHLLPLPRLVANFTGDRGWGIQAEEFIPSGAFVVEYTGDPA